ncbi:Resolvase, N terminal domain [Rhizobium miluonense]|uniref:Resolvase, N terminal domain n=1 Tax=Rhizobium miluonense TaxID=411945 RepID=A0A1C3XEJ4_9HYPH|nr:recombinase family protein [Rhizobium miluonense]SCB50720.1 Resolvase, N terminal domain [Rhizobium miluonense]
MPQVATVSSPAPQQRLIGYVRVSTDEQLNDAQVDELRAAGCHRIHQEHGSGLSRARPVLTKLLKDLSAGDVLVVVRLDRLARSVSHLLQVIENLEGRGVHFRSLHDPIDTSTPQGMFSLQVLALLWQINRRFAMMGHLLYFHRGARDGGVGCCTGGLAEAVR